MQRDWPHVTKLDNTSHEVWEKLTPRSSLRSSHLVLATCACCTTGCGWGPSKLHSLSLVNQPRPNRACPSRGKTYRGGPSVILLLDSMLPMASYVHYPPHLGLMEAKSLGDGDGCVCRDIERHAIVASGSPNCSLADLDPILSRTALEFLCAMFDRYARLLHGWRARRFANC